MSGKRKTFQDGPYKNLVTGLGEIGIDKTEETKASSYTPADLAELARMQMLDGLADIIVCNPVETAFMNDPTLAGDDDGEILEAAMQAGLVEAIQSAGEEMRLTGGAVIVKEYEEEQTGNVPDLKEAPDDRWTLSGFRVYGAGEISLQSSDFEGDTPTCYPVKLMDGNEVRIHPQRCTVFHGKRLPGALKNSGCIREKFFGTSALRPVEKALKDIATVTGSVVNMATETGTLLVTLDGINELLSKPDCGLKDVHDLISMVKLCMNSMRAAFAGPSDKFQILSHNFGGIPDVMQKLFVLAAAKSHMPMSLLFGQSATGLAQTNEGDAKEYAKTVNAWRQRYLYKPSASLFADFAKRNFKKDVTGFTWGTIDTRTITEELDARKKESEIDIASINAGIITADEVRKARYANGHSFELTVDSED